MDSQPSQPNQEDVSVVPYNSFFRVNMLITKIPPTASFQLWVKKSLEEFLYAYIYFTYRINIFRTSESPNRTIYSPFGNGIVE